MSAGHVTYGSNTLRFAHFAHLDDVLAHMNDEHATGHTPDHGNSPHRKRCLPVRRQVSASAGRGL